MITYYITGGTGHLGRSIINELLKNEFDEEFNIVCLILPHEKHLLFDDKNHRIKFIEGNILNKDEVNKFLLTNKGDINYLIHSAGLISIYKKKDDLVYDVNVNGTKNLLDSALNNNINKFIYISSVDAIKKEKNKNKQIKEPISFNENEVTGIYAKSKACATSLVLSYNQLGLETISIHPSALFGPNDYFKGPINTALINFLNDKLNVIVSGGYDIVDVRDVAKGVVSAIKNAQANNSYILSGYPLKIKELIALVSKIANRPTYKLCLNNRFVKIFAPLLELRSKIKKEKPLFTAYSMDCLNQNYNYDCSKAKKELNYTLTPLDISIKDTIKRFKDLNCIN